MMVYTHIKDIPKEDFIEAVNSLGRQVRGKVEEKVLHGVGFYLSLQVVFHKHSTTYTSKAYPERITFKELCGGE